MSVWGIIIIVLALGIILSNIMLVKKTANMKMPDSVLKKAEEKRRYEQQLREKEDESVPAKPESEVAASKHSSNEEAQQKSKDT